MTFKEYQNYSRTTAMYLSLGLPIAMYPTLGLAGEAGEIAEKVKKLYRDDGGIVTHERREDICKELGDVLWYLAQIATDLEIDFEDVAKKNIEKLASRKERGVLHGDGDSR